MLLQERSPKLSHPDVVSESMREIVGKKNNFCTDFKVSDATRRMLMFFFLGGGGRGVVLLLDVSD